MALTCPDRLYGAGGSLDRSHPKRGRKVVAGGGPGLARGMLLDKRVGQPAVCEQKHL